MFDKSQEFKIFYLQFRRKFRIFHSLYHSVSFDFLFFISYKQQYIFQFQSSTLINRSIYSVIYEIDKSQQYQFWVNLTFSKDNDEKIKQDQAKCKLIHSKIIKWQKNNLNLVMRMSVNIKKFFNIKEFFHIQVLRSCLNSSSSLYPINLQLLKLRKYTEVKIILDQSLICEIKPCDKEIKQYVYGQETFGDLTGISFILTFFYHPQGQSTSFIASIQEGASPIVTLTQSTLYSFSIQNTGTIISQQFNSNVWYQIIITEQIIQVCNHLACFQTPHNKTITQNTKFNILNSASTQFNYIKACCIIMYKGITYPNANQINFFNTKFPEVVVNLNIQEKVQSNITVDYSDYQYIAKLGDIFDYDEYDPYLIDDSLLFNSSQYIQINQITLNYQFTFEFRFKQSATFTSDIILLNYTFPSTNSQIYIFLNGSMITYKLNSSTIILIFVQESSNIWNKLLIYNNYTSFNSQIPPLLQILTQNISGFFIVNHAYGYINIGSKNNQFQTGEYFNLFIFRYYQGFFYDDQQVMDINCNIYLNDRCIICNSGYILNDDNSCILTCDSTNYNTILVLSHNQCIRKCHQKCATCSADPNICLTCNSIRASPPDCKCPNQYFEDSVSPKCRKYYPDVTVQTGNVVGYCGAVLQSYTAYLTINYKQTYKTIPLMIISLVGQSFNSTQNNYQTLYNIQSITSDNFTISFLCQVNQQIYILNWISSIGTNILGSYYINYSCYTNSFLTGPLFQDFNGHYCISNISDEWLVVQQCKYKISNQIISFNPTQIKILSEIQNSTHTNISISFYTLYKTYNISSLSLDTQLDDQPKSIRHFIVQRGFYVDSINQYRYVDNARTSTYFKIKQQYNQSMEIYDWLLILASQQCNNNTGPCDFYDSYNSNCNLQFQFCAYKLENSNYFINSTFNYQQCDLNCKTCFGLSTNYINLKTKFCSQICEKTCLTCSTTNNTLCLSCGQFATLISTQCKCNSGYYFDDDDTKLCQKCSKKCVTCKNDDKDYCLSCNSFTILTGTTCLCPIGKYYDENSECQQCSTICKTCMNGQSCTSCIDTLQVLEQGQCYCPNNYYTDNTFKCSHCQFPCENCLDQNTCLTCPADKILFNYKCICDSTKYLDQNGICQDCHQLCTTCNGPQDNQCLACNSVRILSQQNQCLCNKGYYSLDNQCLKCSYYCSECEQKTKCSTCPVNRYLNEMNICVCSQGYYNKDNSTELLSKQL
ncbi:hypothetical protein pb186bvf_001878 [Paramecium bursaria]